MPEMSSTIVATGKNDMEIVQLDHSSGAQCILYKHGATVTHWVPAALKSNALYLSDNALFTAKDEIRGGVPLCFPQFAAIGKLDIHHGFARFSNEWVVESMGLDEERMPFVIMKMTDSEETRKYGFPHSFEALLTVKLLPNALHMALKVDNKDPADSKPMKLTFAFHNYLDIPDILKAKVTGLDGIEYFNKVTQEELTEKRTEIVIKGEEVDNVYRRVSEPVVLHLDDSSKRRIVISKKGCKDYVMWNIGKESIVKYPDMVPTDWQHYICIEAAQAVKAVSVAPGTSHTFEQTLEYKED